VPERKLMFRQNTNIEIRNSKQIRIPNQKMTKTKQGPGAEKYEVFRSATIYINLISRIYVHYPQKQSFFIKK